MILIFFQSCLSPHQMPFIRECIGINGVEKVYYIIPRIDYANRQAMGWGNDWMLADKSVVCKVLPTDDEVAALLCSVNDVRCLFSGIHADTDLFRWFKLSLFYNVKRYLVTEPPYTFDKPLWMHYLRFFLQDYKYVKNIDGVFAIGESCAKYYRAISSRWKVYPFVYVTDNKVYADEDVHGDLKVLFVGSLSKRKNVKVLIEALRGVSNIELTIVGDGTERQSLEQLAIERNVPAKFVGTKAMNEIPSIMVQHDMLVLPSLHDGWGAVVNEALTQGLFAVCSDKCGAKDLLLDARRGKVFANDNANSLKAILEEATENKDNLRADKSYRRNWTLNHVNGKSIASYLVDCITSNCNVPCPWKQ